MESRTGFGFLIRYTICFSLIVVALLINSWANHNLIWIGVSWSILFLNALWLLPVWPFIGKEMISYILKSLTWKRAPIAVAIVGLWLVVIYLLSTKGFFVGVAAVLIVFLLIWAVGCVVGRSFKPAPVNFEKMRIWELILAIHCYLFILVASFASSLIVGSKIGRLAYSQAPSSENVERLETEFVDVRGQIHVHSYLSHDSEGKLEDIARAAKAAGVRWVILTDHISGLPDGNLPAEIDGVLFIYGQERSWEKQGSRFSAPLQKEPAERLHVYGHIEQYRGADDSRWQAIELVNFHANALEKAWTILGRIFSSPAKVYDELLFVRQNNLEYWQSLAERRGRPVPIVVGTDAHEQIKIWGNTLDPYEFMFRLMSTHVILDSDESVSEESILRAIGDGRTYIAFDCLGDPAGFEFMALSRGGNRCFTGGTVKGPTTLWVGCENAFQGDELRLFRDNKIMISEKFLPEMVAKAFLYPEPGFWRVEIWRNGKPWIISGQILVK